MECRPGSYEQICIWIDLIDSSVDDFLYAMDLEGDRYHIGASALKRFRLPSNDFGGASAALIDVVWPEDSPHLQQELDNVISGRQAEHNLQYRWITREGLPAWINCRGSVLTRNGRPVLMIGCINDISRIDHADQRGKAMQLVGDGIYTDLGEIDLENDTFRHLYHKEKEYQIPGSSGCYSQMVAYAAERIVFPDDRTGYCEFMDIYTLPERLAGGERLQADFRKLTVSGIWCWSRYTLFRDAGKVLWVVQNIQAENSPAVAVPRSASDPESAELVRRTQKGMDRGEFFFELQPQYRDLDEKIVGVEALMRWRDPEKGILYPGAFIPMLEESGYITALDCHVWELVCRWIASLRRRGIHPVPVSINVSRVDIESIDVTSYIRYLINKYEIPAQMIKVEITESAYAHNKSRVNSTVHELQKTGISVLMDDFGSGYSSLNALRDLNFDMIKLDCAFNEDLANTERGDRILENVKRMAVGMNLPVVVEGVETRGQLEHLKAMGYTYVQGYVYSKPTTVDAIEQILMDGTAVSYDGIQMQADIMYRELLENRRVNSKLCAALSMASMNSWEWNIDTGTLTLIIMADREQYAAITPMLREEFSVIKDFPRRLSTAELPPDTAKALADYCSRIAEARPGEVIRALIPYSLGDGTSWPIRLNGSIEKEHSRSGRTAWGFFRHSLTGMIDPIINV